MTDLAHTTIEQQLTVLLRRGTRIHLATQHGNITLERSAYGIMCKLADEGPQRLGALAVAFGLDPSTITRQVQDLERNGLVAREDHPLDGRVSVLRMTASGRQVLRKSRRHRRARLQKALSEWSAADLTDLGRLLKEFNASLDGLTESRELQQARR